MKYLKFLLWVVILTSSMARGEVPSDEFYYMKSFTAAETYQTNGLDSRGKPIQNPHLDDQGYGPWMFGIDHDNGQKKTFGVDACYLNEGHAQNNHRDGYCAMGYFKMSQDEDKGLKVSIGLGPYFSYNTTNNFELQRDSKALGLIAAAVIEEDLSRKLGIKVRVEILHTTVPNSFDGTIVFAGLSKSIGHSEKRDFEPSDVDEALENHYDRWSIAGGATQPNSALGKLSARGFEIEATDVTKGDDSGLIYSAILKHEGNTGVTDRNGFAAQVGYEVKSSTGWIVGAEAGPYLEHDSGFNRTRLDAISGLYVGRQIKSVVVNVVYRRMAEFSNAARDADGYMLQIGHRTH